jgi:hypothetical protein
MACAVHRPGREVRPMTTPPRRRRSSPSALHAAAVATLLAFGCTTVRAPVSGIAPTVAVHGSAAEPQVELWLESARDVSPQESAAATAQARDALRQALEGRALGDDDVLVVRAQAVSRTRSHRNDQRAAVAGIVVGAVAIAAIVVVAMASGKGGGAPRIGAPARGVARGGVARPGHLPARPVPAPVALPHAPAPRVAAPSRGAGGASVHLDVGVVADVPYEEPAEANGEDALAPAAWAPPPPPAAPTERISTVTLPPPEPLQVDRRGFFDGDWLRLELRVVDARTGGVRWEKTVAEDVDVRDARKVRRVIDRALAEGEGWYAPAAGAY